MTDRETNNVALPNWLAGREDYVPPADRDRYLGRSMLAIGGVLRQFRLDDGSSHALSPSAPVKLVFGLAVILLVSLARNFAFVLVVLALLLVRVALLPAAALRRVAGVAAGAAALSALLMLPAALLGQPHSAVLIGTKVLVSVGVALTVALTTPYNELTAALRVFRVPALIVLTIDLALKNIVRLGATATEVLTALRLRSVGRNARKARAVGGVAGTVFLKSNEAAATTYESMVCRGFDGDYAPPCRRWLRAADAAWVLLLAALVAAFAYLQGVL